MFPVPNAGGEGIETSLANLEYEVRAWPASPHFAPLSESHNKDFEMNHDLGIKRCCESTREKDDDLNTLFLAVSIACLPCISFAD